MQESQTFSHRRSSEYGQALLNIAKAPRWRSLILTLIFLTIACLTWRGNHGRLPNTHLPSWDRFTKSDDHHVDSVRPAALQLSNLTLDLESGDRKVIPAQLKKGNPQFHLLVHAPKINAGVCRCLLSSYILDYPPPTLIGYQPSDNSTEESETNTTKDQNGIPDVSDYLRNEEKIRPEDAVLVVDGETTLFQLPSEILLSSLTNETKRRNHDLASLYPPVALYSRSGPHFVQRFNQSVVFASNREFTTGPAKPTYDLFGRPTQSVAQVIEEHHINDAAIVGTGSTLRRLFYAASTANNQITRPDALTFRTMFAQQTRVRSGIFNSQSRRRSLWRIWKLWLCAKFSVDRAVRFEQEKEDRAAAVRDLGIGLDDASKIIYAIPEGDSSEDAEHRFGYVASATEAGLDIPKVLREKGVRGPFAMHPSHLHPNLTLPASSSSARQSRDERDEGPVEDDWGMEEELPSPDTPWTSIPLIVDPRTASVAPVLSGVSDDVYEKIWFHPYARTLLDQYLLRSRSKEVASEAAVGGERWWDSRGGRGGAWTANGEWLDARELCEGYGADLFVDGDDFWTKEETIEQANVHTVVVNVATPAPAEGDEETQGTGEVESEASQEESKSNDEEDEEERRKEEEKQRADEEEVERQKKAEGEKQEYADAPEQPGDVTEAPEETEEAQDEAQVQEKQDEDRHDMPLAVMPDGSVKALSEINGEDDSSLLMPPTELTR